VRLQLNRSGYYLLGKHNYLPIPDESDRRAAFLDADSDLPGLELDASQCFRRRVCSATPYRSA
jgi:hypothetical protein